MSADRLFYPRAWSIPIGVSYHARQRYWQRVCADVQVADVCWSIREMWRQSYTATDDDLVRLHVRRRPGDVLRVGRAQNGLRFLLIARENVIVTILEMR